MIKQNDTLEISQVANGFIVRIAGSGWFNQDHDSRNWIGTKDDYMVFRTLSELQHWLGGHFTHRARPDWPDLMPPAAKAEKAA